VPSYVCVDYVGSRNTIWCGISDTSTREKDWTKPVATESRSVVFWQLPIAQYIDCGVVRVVLQGMGGCLVHKIDGDYYNVMGMLLDWTMTILQ